MGGPGHGLLEVSPGPAMLYPSTHYGRATPEAALWPFQGWPTHRIGCLRPSSTPLDTPRRAPMIQKQTTDETQVCLFEIIL
jgi:hypothetical protein